MAKHNQYTGFSRRVEIKRQKRRKQLTRILFISVLFLAILIWVFIYIGNSWL